MATEKAPKRIDISSIPELVKLVQEVRTTNETAVLQQEREDLAMLTPLKRHCQLIAYWDAHQARRGISPSVSDPLCCYSPRDFLADLKTLDHDLAICGGGESVTSWSEVLGDRTIRGEEPLCMAR